MTRLFDATYEEVSEFIKRLAVAGFTAEQRHELTTDRVRMKAWVAWLGATQQHVTVGDGSFITVKDAFQALDRTLASCLYREDIYYLHELADWSEDELCGVRNIGIRRLGVICLVLAKNGLSLSQHLPNDPNRVLSQQSLRAYPRATIQQVRVSRLVALKTGPYVIGYNAMLKITLGEFRMMSEEGLKEFFTQSGVDKIRHFIAENGL